MADRQHTAAKTFGRHTDDGKRVTVDDDSLADGGGIAVPTPLPEPMTDEDSHVFKAGSLWEGSKAKKVCLAPIRGKAVGCERPSFLRPELAGGTAGTA